MSHFASLIALPDFCCRPRNTAQKVVWRARIVLLAGGGLTAEAIAAAVGKSVPVVRHPIQKDMGSLSYFQLVWIFQAGS